MDDHLTTEANWSPELLAAFVAPILPVSFAGWEAMRASLPVYEVTLFSDCQLSG